MIKKLAVLVVEKAGSVETLAGEKGEIYAAARFVNGTVMPIDGGETTRLF